MKKKLHAAHFVIECNLKIFASSAIKSRVRPETVEEEFVTMLCPTITSSHSISRGVTHTTHAALLFWNNLLIVISQHHVDNTPELHFSGKPSLINCCFAGPKTLRHFAGSLQPRCLLMIFAWVHRSSQRVPSGSGGGFWVFSLGIFHGVWLIVKGGFLTSVSHIFHGPRGLVRNRMTAYAHAVSTEERGRSQTSKYVLTAVRRFGVSVSGTKHCSHSMGYCLHATWPTWSVTAGIFFTESITQITHLFHCM